MDVAQARAVLTLDDTQYQREIKKAGQAFDQMGKDVEAAGKRAAANVGAALSSLGTRFSIGITAPLTALGAASVRSATQMDSLKRGLTAVAGSSAEAERQLKRLDEIAKLPGLGRVEAIQGSIQLQAAGLSAKTAEKSLLAFGNALATVGKGKAELDGVTLALTQITAKGKVTAEEINQIAERVPQVRKAMQAAFGTASTEELQKLGVSAEEFIDKITTELGKLPRVTGGAQNAFENLQDAIQKALSTIGQQLLPTVIPIVTRLAERAVALAEAFGRLPAPVRKAILVMAGLAAAAGPVLMVSGQLIGAFGAVKTLLPGLMGGLNGIKAAVIALPLPLKLVALAVGALAVAWATDFGGIRTTTQEFVDWVKPALSATWEVLLENAKQFLGDLSAGFHSAFTNISKAFSTLGDILKAAPGLNPLAGAMGPLLTLTDGLIGRFEKLNPVAQEALKRVVPGLGAIYSQLKLIRDVRDRMNFKKGAQSGLNDIFADLLTDPWATPAADDRDPDYKRDPKEKKTKQRADTPYEQQWKAYHQALNAARREQELLQQGASDTAISVANQYNLIDQARQQTLAGVLDEIKSMRDANQIWATFRSELTQAQVKLKEVSGTDEGGLVGLRKRFQGLIPDDVLTKLMEVNTAIAVHEERTRKAKETQQRLTQMTESLGQQSLQLSQELARMLSPATNAATFAFQELGLAWDDLTGTQKTLVHDMLGTTRQIDQLRERVYLFKEVASGIEGVFMDAFSNIGRGFGSFFGSLVGGFQRMLQQMAAQYLASRLASIFTSFLGNVLGANFGGVIKPQGRAMGGYVGANKPYMVGERGPELFLPRNSGTIVPSGSGAGATINQTFHITTPDVQGFNQNRRSIMADAAADARRQLRRDGG